MRVVMVSQFPEDLDHPAGGVEAVAACLTRGLVARGVEVMVIRLVEPGSPARKSSPADPRGFPILGVPRYWPATLTNWLVSPFAIGRLIREIAPDVVHVQGLPELYRGCKVPSVLTVHGMTFRDAIYRGSWAAKPISWFLRVSFMKAIQRYRDIITISPYVRAELGERPGRRYCDISNPIEDRFFRIERRPEPGTALYVGMLSRRKNIVGLVEGFARARSQVPGIHLRLAGPWYGDCEPLVREAIRQNRLEESVTFLGSLSREELENEFSRCSCMVLASFQETAPMAIEEAMAAGVPVLASRVGGVEWMVEHERTGFLFDPYRPDELGQHLTRILTDECLRDRMGAAARDWASENYRLEGVVDRTMAVYERAIAEHSEKNHEP